MTFDQYIGMERAPESESSARISIEPHHCNPTGNVNGGVIISLADNLSTGVANRCSLREQPATTTGSWPR